MISRTLPRALHDFFFAPVDARGFRLMRAGWAVTALFVMARFATRVPYLFAEPKTAGQTILVYPHAWSVLYWINTPAGVTALYGVLAAACIAMVAGYRPRLATIVAVVLFASFAQRDIEVFHTEATLLRLFGWILVLASFHEGYARPARVWGGEGAGRLTIPAWVYRLLLWQVIVIYIATGWHKFVSPFWAGGEAVQSILHWEYSRLTQEQADLFKPFSAFLSYSTIGWELAWAVLLVPVAAFTRPAKRVLIAVGILMHGAWAAFLNGDILPLSMAMAASYFGLLTDADWRLLASFKNVKRR